VVGADGLAPFLGAKRFLPENKKTDVAGRLRELNRIRGGWNRYSQVKERGRGLAEAVQEAEGCRTALPAVTGIRGQKKGHLKKWYRWKGRKNRNGKARHLQAL